MIVAYYYLFLPCHIQVYFLPLFVLLYNLQKKKVLDVDLYGEKEFCFNLPSYKL
jgi:hypothetical protein